MFEVAEAAVEAALAAGARYADARAMHQRTALHVRLADHARLGAVVVDRNSP